MNFHGNIVIINLLLLMRFHGRLNAVIVARTRVTARIDLLYCNICAKWALFMNGSFDDLITNIMYV